MTRRTLFWAALAAPLAAADPASEAWDLITDAATALGSGSAGEFLAPFDPAMPNYEALRANVTALVQQNQAQSAIQFTRNEGDGQARELELDWQLLLTSREDTARVTRRRETVKCRVEKHGRKWRIVSIAPEGFFAPPGV
jgi:hypothetical protein